ncbi:hypothetical protein CFP75_00780 [Amycolatopsis alba DSM 44262]|uniref:PH domain-containing protein n=1 Tax=Amycolatopsis alba DSM 44262 TaxID=1125972 RepID=A0A229S9L1_AMYAL|nr:hypothetical protein CFP75_00780 [Amycolatopsis alba DSM 44262]
MLLVEIVLFSTGLISLGDGILAATIVEASVFFVVVFELIALRSAIKRARAEGLGFFDAVSATLNRIMPERAATIVRHDLKMMRALWLVAARRQDVPADGDAIAYSGPMRPIFWVFLFLNPIEIALVELIVPWPAVRLALLILGVLGTIWFLALISSLYKYPHTVDSRTLRLRYLSFFDFRVPVAKIESVGLRTRSRELKKGNDVVDGVLVMEIVKTTNVTLRLREPHQADFGHRGIKEFDSIEFWADDPREAAKLIRNHLAG